MPTKYIGKEEVVCRHCGKTYRVFPSRIRTGKALHCSRACKAAARTMQALRDATARFWAKVDQSGGPLACWPWTGRRTRDGYGVFSAAGIIYYAHRYAATLTGGPLPDGIQCLHKCDNPPCCNPAHLMRGTPADNMRDMVEKGRSARGDQHSSRLHPDRVARGERHGSRTQPASRVRGEGHPASRLTAEQVREIRTLHLDGPLSAQQIAVRFGVTRGCVRNILDGKTWRHVA